MIDRNQRFVLWIDSVASVLVCPQDRIWIGQAVPDAGVALAFQANLRRRHLLLTRVGGRYWLERPTGGPSAASPSTPAASLELPSSERLLTSRGSTPRTEDNVDPELVASGQTIDLGVGLGLRLRIPSPLTSTAVLDYVGPLRSVPRTDFAILLAQACLLGNRSQDHISVETEAPLTLFFQGSSLALRGPSSYGINQRSATGISQLQDGDRVETESLSFSIEVLRD